MKVKLSLLFGRIGVNISNLDQRINLQKAIYLLKERGAINENYEFGWYRFGPYSSSLAKDAFSFFNDGIDKEIEVSDDFTEYIEALKSAINTGKDEIKWLELLACIQYIRKDSAQEKEKTFEKLVKLKPYFDNRLLFCKAWNVVNTFFSS